MDKGTQNPKVKILLDADLIIHFYKADKIFDLPNIFNDSELVLFDLVWEELNRTALKFAIELMLKNGSIRLEDFPTDDDLIDYEYELLRFDGRGKGESACMAYAKYNKENVIASSNLSDLLPYCDENKISYMTTIDVLCSAMNQKIYSEDDCNEFIKKVIEKGSDLPINKMKDFDCFNRKILRYRKY